MPLRLHMRCHCWDICLEACSWCTELLEAVQAIHLLQHTRHSGVAVTTAQANITIMALGKLGDVEVSLMQILVTCLIAHGSIAVFTCFCMLPL